MPTTLPGRLRARIRQLGMTAADVAALAEVNRSFIYDIIRARSGRPATRSATARPDQLAMATPEP